MFLDLKKAFDTVDHTLLLEKLHHYGLRGNINLLIKSYLSNRRQYVNQGDLNSSTLPVNIGVPQGSVLGPLLFNIFINDICNITDFDSILFADDAVFYSSNKNFDICIRSVRNCLNKLSSWLASNKLTPNVLKTKLMLFTPRTNIELPQLYFNNEVVKWVNEYKYLGVIIDNKLTFNSEIRRVGRKINISRGIMYACSKLLPRDSLISIYYSLVYSYLIQSIIFWGASPQIKVNNIKVTINNILRIILNVKRNEFNIPLMSNAEMYLELKFLKFDDVYKYFLCKLVRNCRSHHHFLFDQYYSPYEPLNIHNTRNNKFNLPLVKTETLKRLPIFQSIKAFNELPDNLSDENIKDNSFKIKFKKHSLEKLRTDDVNII